jgi:hypothetical protein
MVVSPLGSRLMSATGATFRAAIFHSPGETSSPAQMAGAGAGIRVTSLGERSPGSMVGLKLAHAVRNRWPPIKVIIVSGHVRLDDDDLPTDSRFFGKPFQAEGMIGELRAMIDV